MNRHFLVAFISLVSLVTVSTAKADIDTQQLIAGYGKQALQTLYAQSPTSTFSGQYGQAQSLFANQGSTLLVPIMPNGGTLTPSQITVPAISLGSQDLGQTAILNWLTSSGTSLSNYQQALNTAVTGGSSFTDSAATAQNPGTLVNYDVKTLLGPLAYP